MALVNYDEKSFLLIGADFFPFKFTIFQIHPLYIFLVKRMTFLKSILFLVTDGAMSFFLIGADFCFNLPVFSLSTSFPKSFLKSIFAFAFLVKHDNLCRNGFLFIVVNEYRIFVAVGRVGGGHTC